VRIVAIALLLGGCFSKPPRPDVGNDGPAPDDGPTAEGWLPGYQARKRVDVAPPTTSVLVDFPIVIAPATADPDIDARARVDGRDLVVTGVDGTTLLHSELVDYKDGLFEVWVKLPMLADNLSVYLYYGSADGASPDPTTWSAYTGVWHMSGAAEEPDSTSNSSTLSAVPANTPTTTTGKVGRARSFDGSDSLFGGTPTVLDFGTGSFSFSLWANVTLPAASNFGTGFFKGGTNTSEPGFCWLMGNELWTTKLTDNLSFVEAEIGPAASFAGDWVHLTTVVDRNARTLTAYVNGAPATFNSISPTFGSMTTNQPFELSHNSGGEAYKGLLDEIHVYTTALPADWIATEFANQSGASSFLQLQGEELAP
jgi:hypothetical protein